MKKHAVFAVAVIVAAALAGSPALAKKPEHAGSSHKNAAKVIESKTGDHVGIVFADSARDAARRYLREHRGHTCPPGLAKKMNGCLPPGQAKKYSLGGVLPRGYAHPPHDLVELLGPPPKGAFYAMVDKDVLLVSEATKKILDAVTLMSAME